jgi:hypothetical protein
LQLHSANTSVIRLRARLDEAEAALAEARAALQRQALSQEAAARDAPSGRFRALRNRHGR